MTTSSKIDLSWDQSWDLFIKKSASYCALCSSDNSR